MNKITYEIFHRTVYEYEDPVTISNHTIHLQPRAFPEQRIINSQVVIEPQPSTIHEYDDYFGNPAAFFTIEAMHERLEIDCRSEVEVTVVDKPDPLSSPAWESVRDNLHMDATSTGLLSMEFSYASRYVPELQQAYEYARQSFTPGRPLLDAALDLNTRIFDDFTFDSSATTVSTPVLEVYENKRGVCQDFAHFMLSCLRSLGLAARYVSGYLRTLPPPGQAKIFGADASHAWIAVYCPKSGWLQLDPTNNRYAESDYVVLGWGRDYSDVSLIRGVLAGGSEHSLSFSVNMEEKQTL